MGRNLGALGSLRGDGVDTPARRAPIGTIVGISRKRKVG